MCDVDANSVSIGISDSNNNMIMAPSVKQIGKNKIDGWRTSMPGKFDEKAKSITSYKPKQLHRFCRASNR